MCFAGLSLSAFCFIHSTFPTAESVLGGARHMVAMHIARDPMVRQCIRQIYYERAKLNITPTKKGKKVRHIVTNR